MGRQAIFPSIADLKLDSGRVDGDVVFVVGEPEGFRFDSTLAAFDDVKTHFSIGMGAGGWIRQVKGITRTGSINVLDHGLLNDDATANDTALTDLLTWMKTLDVRPALHFPTGFYRFSAQAVFDIPWLKVIGDGMDATVLIGDNGFRFNYQNPTIRDLAISPQSATSYAQNGLELANCWQAIVENVSIQEFGTAILLRLDDEGEGFIPGNAPPSYTVKQFGSGGRHRAWPTMYAMIQDSLTTQEHAGSRVTIAKFQNCHLQSDSATGVGIKMENPLADVTNDYNDFNTLSNSLKAGVFFTGITITEGHFICDGVNIHIGGGIHGVKISDTYLDIRRIGIKLDYGAQSVSLENVSLDLGSNAESNWIPDKTYAVDDRVRRGENAYICTVTGDSAASVNFNGVPNSEFVGVEDIVLNQPTAEGANPDDITTGPHPYGMDITSSNVQVFVLGLSTYQGKRWLELATYLDPADAGSSENANFWFADLGLADRNIDAVSGDQLQASFQIQNMDPGVPYTPNLTGQIRSANSSGGSTENSTGVDIDALSGFSSGSVVTYTESDTLSVGTTARSSPFLLVNYSAGESGWFRFRVAVPQINKGVTLGNYVRTTGQRRAAWSVGPQGTGTGISDGAGALEWDYDGEPNCAIRAPRVAFEANSRDSRGEIEIVGKPGRTSPPLSVTPPADRIVMYPNPTNSNNHPTAMPD